MALALCTLLLQDPEQVKAWVEQLGAHEFEKREEAMRAIIECGEGVLPMLDAYDDTTTLEVLTRLREIRRALTTIRAADIFALAEKALDPNADPETWRPALLEKLQPYFAHAAAEMPTAARENLKSVVDTPLMREYEVVRKNAETVQDLILAVDDARGARVSSYVVVICRSGDFNRIGGAVVICLGSLKADRINDSVVFARSVEVARDVRRSLVFAREGLASARAVRDCAVYAPGGVKALVTMNNLWLNGTTATATQQSTNDREVSVAKIGDR